MVVKVPPTSSRCPLRQRREFPCSVTCLSCSFSFSMTREASSPTSRVDRRIGLVKGVPSNTVRLPRVLRRRAHAAKRVNFVGYVLQMSRIDTRSVPAEVVGLQRTFSVDVFVHQDVRVLLLPSPILNASDGDKPITSFRGRPFPEPARLGLLDVAPESHVHSRSLRSEPT